jgi:hypothetical protein
VEAVAGERVDRDVDPVDPGLDQRPRVSLEQIAVGCHREIADPVDRREHRDQAGELAPGEWLAAGQADIGDAEPGERPDEPLDLLEAENFRTVEPRHPLGGHAVATAEVAPVGDRDPQIGDRPVVRVAKRVRRFAHGAEDTDTEACRR